MLRPGVRAECATYDVAQARRTTMRQAMDCDLPTQALAWMRIALRAVLPALGEEEESRAYEWLCRGQRRAVQSLHGGEAVAFAVTARGVRIEWTARPVLYVPLAERQAGALPPCREKFACGAMDPGHRCGARRAALDELTAEAVEMGVYDEAVRRGRERARDGIKGEGV